MKKTINKTFRRHFIKLKIKRWCRITINLLRQKICGNQSQRLQHQRKPPRMAATFSLRRVSCGRTHSKSARASSASCHEKARSRPDLPPDIVQWGPRPPQGSKLMNPKTHPTSCSNCLTASSNSRRRSTWKAVQSDKDFGKRSWAYRVSEASLVNMRSKGRLGKGLRTLSMQLATRYLACMSP